MEVDTNVHQTGTSEELQGSLRRESWENLAQMEKEVLAKPLRSSRTGIPKCVRDQDREVLAELHRIHRLQ